MSIPTKKMKINNVHMVENIKTFADLEKIFYIMKTQPNGDNTSKYAPIYPSPDPQRKKQVTLCLKNVSTPEGWGVSTGKSGGLHINLKIRRDSPQAKALELLDKWMMEVQLQRHELWLGRKGPPHPASLADMYNPVLKIKEDSPYDPLVKIKVPLGADGEPQAKVVVLDSEGERTSVHKLNGCDIDSVFFKFTIVYFGAGCGMSKELVWAKLAEAEEETNYEDFTGMGVTSTKNENPTDFLGAPDANDADDDLDNMFGASPVEGTGDVKVEDATAAPPTKKGAKDKKRHVK